MNTITLELMNTGVLQLLEDLEALHLIKIQRPVQEAKGKLSDKYRGTLTPEEGEDLNNHIQQMRSEWNNS